MNCSSSSCSYLPGANVVGTAVEARRTSTVSFVAVIPDSLGVNVSSLGVDASSLASAVSTVVSADPAYSDVAAPSVASITVSQAVLTHREDNTSSGSGGLSGNVVALVVFFVLLVVVGLAVAAVVFFVLKGRETDMSGAKGGDISTNAKGMIVESNAPTQDQATTKEIHSIL